MPDLQPITLVLVEDDPGHARLIEKNLRRASLSNDLVMFNNGYQAVEYVFCEGDYESRNPNDPLLILLDLNLPGMDGYEILQRVKSNQQTRQIPIVILTTTDDPREIARCYELGCNVYVTKPVDYEQFSEAIQKLGLFLAVVSVPGGS